MFLDTTNFLPSHLLKCIVCTCSVWKYRFETLNDQISINKIIKLNVFHSEIVHFKFKDYLNLI